MNKIQEYIERLDVQDEISRLDIESINLQYSVVTEVSNAINEILEDMEIKIEGRLYLLPMAESDQLIVIGNKADREMIKKFVAEIDVPERPSEASPEIFKIPNADPNEIIELIQQLLSEVNRPKNRIQIETKVLALSENFWDEISEESNLRIGSETSLDDIQASSFLEAALTDAGTKMVVEQQNMTVSEYQTTEFFKGQTLPFLTGYTEPNSPDEEAEHVYERRQIGIHGEFRPRITPENNINLFFKLDNSQISGYEERIFNDKYKEQVSLTSDYDFTTNATIPAGKTLFIDGGTITMYESDQTGYSSEQKRLLILVKPNIIPPEPD
ncbi:hypothetical protein ACFLZ8_01485 [Planctomycetota bacterium]